MSARASTEQPSRRARFRLFGGRAAARGFTMIELLVVIAILGLLAAIATPQIVRFLGRAKTDAARVEIKNLSVALDLFLMDVGRYPSTQEGLMALLEPPPGSERWRGPYLKARGVPLDPWGRPYLYRAPGRGPYDIYTLGADHVPGGEGENQDVTNW